jgi:hypothetical protein
VSSHSSGRTDDASAEERADRLGRQLASAAGYLVLGPDGELGRVAYIRYQKRTDRPDEIIVKHGVWHLRTRTIPFTAIEDVKPREHVVLVRS